MKNSTRKQKKLYITLYIFSFVALAIMSCATTMWVIFWPHFINIINNGHNLTTAGTNLRNETFIVTILLIILFIPIVIISSYIRFDKKKLNEEYEMNAYFEDIALKNKELKTNNSFGINFDNDLVKSVMERDNLASISNPIHMNETNLDINANQNDNNQPESGISKQPGIQILNASPFPHVFNIENNRFGQQIDNGGFVNFKQKLPQKFGYDNNHFPYMNNMLPPQPFLNPTHDIRAKSAPYFSNVQLNNSFQNNFRQNLQQPFSPNNFNKMHNFNNASDNIQYSPNTNRFNNFHNTNTYNQNPMMSVHNNYSSKHDLINQDIQPIHNRFNNYNPPNLNLHNKNNDYVPSRTASFSNAENRQPLYEQTKNIQHQSNNDNVFHQNWTPSRPLFDKKN